MAHKKGESKSSYRARTGQGKPVKYAYRTHGQQFPVRKYHITDTDGTSLTNMHDLEEPTKK